MAISRVLVAIFVAHFSGNAIDLAGNIVVLFYNNKDERPFIVGTILAGFSETLARMQTYTKSVLDTDVAVLEHKSKVH